jgi:hypothetical protein
VSVDLAAVVVSYHSSDDLRRFVQSWDACRPRGISTSLTIALVEAWDGEIAEADSWGHAVQAFSQNIGYGRACNRSAVDLDCDSLAFFNADVEMTHGVLESCHELLMADSRNAVVGPRQVSDFRTQRLTHAGIMGTNTQPILRAWQQMDRGQYNKVEDAVSVSGSAYFVRRDAWDDLRDCSVYQDIDPGSPGAFLQVPLLYFEETWLSVHARAHGYRVLYNGASPTLIHRWHGAISKTGEKTYFADSQAVFRAACAGHGIPCN